MRTDEEKQEFTDMCVAIEKAGGDVLGFIREQWPSYTPGGCWHNLQRGFTRRIPSKITFGGKDEKKMAKTRQSQEKTVQLLLEAEKNHQDAWAVLTACGYTNPHCALRNAKNWCSVNHPEWLESLRNIHLYDPNPKSEKKAPDAPQTALKDSPKDDSPKAVETPETAIFNQTEYVMMTPEKMTNPPWPKDMDKTIDDVKVYVPKVSPTGGVPGPYKAVEAPEEPPKEKTKMKVIEVETDLGAFRKEEDKIAFRRADDGKDYKNQLKMTVPQWKQLIAEMDDVLNMLEEIEY